jgi:Tfp pilus assembly protein PilV
MMRGFTLIEALIAMVVLMIAILAMLSVIPFGFNGAQTNSIQIQAVSVGQQYLEQERYSIASGNALVMPSATTVPIDPGQAFQSNGTVAAVAPGAFTVTPDKCVTTKYSGTYTNVYSCAVTVSWTQSNATHSVTVQSYVTK